MKKAVAWLQPYIEANKKGDAKAAGKILMATVKGDVHDIGKNIVGVVLGCNNYDIIDMGVMVPAAKILEKAREVGADIIGLSGLITPSLDEMVYVAKEMEREGFTVPLLIGGATTSKTHTAVKIEPEYSGPVVYVLDASRSVSIASTLLSEDENNRSNFVLDVKKEYAGIRESRANKKDFKKYLSLEKARENGFVADWTNYHPPVPAKTGVYELDVAVEALLPYIDWTPFFSSWQLAGKYPAIMEDPVVGSEAKKLYNDAQSMLRRIIDEHWLQTKAVIGLFPANSTETDDVEIYADENRTHVVHTLHFLRQQRQKAANQPNLCLSDFIAPKGSYADYIGAFAVTAGMGIEPHVKRFEEEHDDYHAIMLKALADRLAEAMAEYVHERVRKEYWAYASEESLENDALIAEKYQGIRPAPGYPACPEHTEKGTLWDMLQVEQRTGITLTESYAMYPAASVSGWYFSHPGAKYFGLGQINRDQVEDYAQRKGMDMATAEKWLAPVINGES